ncbi:intracellular adhesion protein D [Staphylococcus epidermidis VCU112]|nr:intracellular adhesion protein D [Staphylococcus epidermidis NIHLM095]EJD78512.1 intracellular adhesion protein D [Staphylococcus epidermidis NIHLM087]TIC92168.1 intracellular adhesion protein D [Staphylococcus epidermidis VCU112]
MYCIVVMIVYIGTLINSQMESVITIRIALNVENTEIYKLFGLMSLFVLIIFIFFTFSLAFQKYKKGRDI